MKQTQADACIVYTTDSSYMFPTLVSAMQARQHTSVAKADVIIFCVDLDHQTEDTFATICERESILLAPLSRRLIEGQTAMLARLFLDEFVPRCYSQILYMDSDVHILDSLDALIDANVGEGHFLAANDPMTFLLMDKGSLSRRLEKHLAAIGLDKTQSLNYFNSGVLRICRKGWGAIGKEAWRQFQKNGHSSRFPDQDALNLAGIVQRQSMSLAWNFPIFMRHSRVEAAIKPKIEHFMSSPKPWHGVFPPWSNAAHEPYRSALEQYPFLKDFVRRMPASQRTIYHVQQRGKQMLETLTWGFSRRRLRILEYEAGCRLLQTADHIIPETRQLAG
jgi:lipopolysaccharide biosynthesis glycosyltransferase